MSDAFDMLRETDRARREWVQAARAFERAVARLHDASTIKWLERSWAKAADSPLAPAEKGWQLVSDALEAVAMEAPLSFEEADRHGIESWVLFSEQRAWQEAMRERRHEYDEAPIPEGPL